MKKYILYLLLPSFVLTLFAVNMGFSHSNSAPVIDCTSCHQGKLKTDIVSISGLPKAYEPGMTYKLTIKISSDLEAMGESRGGFALQATGGKIVITNKKDTQYIEKFLTHTLEGSKSRSWSFSWQAPKTGDEVTLTVMAIASNGDYSAVGDLIGAQSYAIKALKK